MQRSEIVNMADEAYKKVGGSLNQNQVKKYMSVIRNANNLEEYIVFLRYQLRKSQEAAEILTKDVKTIAGSDFEKNKGDIGYYFGTISRLLKIYEKSNAKDQGD